MQGQDAWKSLKIFHVILQRILFRNYFLQVLCQLEHWELLKLSTCFLILHTRGSCSSVATCTAHMRTACMPKAHRCCAFAIPTIKQLPAGMPLSSHTLCPEVSPTQGAGLMQELRSKHNYCHSLCSWFLNLSDCVTCANSATWSDTSVGLVVSLSLGTKSMGYKLELILYFFCKYLFYLRNHPGLSENETITLIALCHYLKFQKVWYTGPRENSSLIK